MRYVFERWGRVPRSPHYCTFNFFKFLTFAVIKSYFWSIKI